MNNSVEKVVELFGKYVNGQITMTWETRQTAEQYAEIREQGGESAEFELEEFIEYVKSNVASSLSDILESKDGEYALTEDVFVLDSDGVVVEF